MSYLGFFGEALCERVIEKSRFLGYASRIADEEEAKRFLEKLRAIHPAATHVCYGYVADALGNLQRFSDAGEPQGTAGLPILGVLKAQKLCRSAVAVVRYFGGVKLGAGGLTRAYASLAAEVTELAQKRSFEPCDELRLVCSYADVGALMRCLADLGAEICGRDFSEMPSVTVAVRGSERGAFERDLIDRMNGRVKTECLRSYQHPFPVG